MRIREFPSERVDQSHGVRLNVSAKRQNATWSCSHVSTERRRQLRRPYLPINSLGIIKPFPTITGRAVEVAPIFKPDRSEAIGNAFDLSIPRKCICCRKLETASVPAIDAWKQPLWNGALQIAGIRQVPTSVTLSSKTFRSM